MLHSVSTEYLPMNAEEEAAIKDLLDRMRAEKRKFEEIEKERRCWEAIIEATIGIIGLDETKRLLRDFNKALRDGMFEGC